jgi:hypothetical protein
MRMQTSGQYLVTVGARIAYPPRMRRHLFCLASAFIIAASTANASECDKGLIAIKDYRILFVDEIPLEYGSSRGSLVIFENLDQQDPKKILFVYSPGTWELWLALEGHQNEVIGFDRNGLPELSPADRRYLFEKILQPRGFSVEDLDQIDFREWPKTRFLRDPFRSPRKREEINKPNMEVKAQGGYKTYRFPIGKKEQIRFVVTTPPKTIACSGYKISAAIIDDEPGIVSDENRKFRRFKISAFLREPKSGTKCNGSANTFYRAESEPIFASSKNTDGVEIRLRADFELSDVILLRQ